MEVGTEIALTAESPYFGYDSARFDHGLVKGNLFTVERESAEVSLL